MTCEKRSLTCTYGANEEVFDENSSPKRRMVETAPGSHLQDEKSPQSPAVATPGPQSKTWAIVSDGPLPSPNGVSDAFHKRHDSQSLGTLLKSEEANYPNDNVTKVLQPKKVDAANSRDSTTSQADEEAVVYSNTRMLQDPTGRLCKVDPSSDSTVEEPKTLRCRKITTTLILLLQCISGTLPRYLSYS